ncbi:hypothetical protein NDN08_007781 [Rhodosorus marinus]|uniref:Aminotransferase class I/classII large domain-containing protein n=1 Tax=Rhodosorus marinus TaxID=101924 RepID=A0AAV8V036_9RHOD|nr:hypothetical protein NDN08_007781 [Rhodosorus marinus]
MSSVLRLETMNPYVRKAQYAVRGRLYSAALERSKAGLPVVYTNIGNPHGLGQKPITFFRQVVAIVNYPGLLEDEATRRHFPEDVIKRARLYLNHFKGGTGSYQDSRGNAYIREEVAKRLEERDGTKPDISSIFLTDGASAGVSRCLQALIQGSADAVLTPTPQYPIYAAAINLFNGTSAEYYLDEQKGWGLDLDELDRARNKAHDSGGKVRGLVVINPGNPTGQCLSEKNMLEIVEWCKRKKVVLFADEVYQENVYSSGRQFVSFRKVISESKQASDLECFSFHTISKGMVGECGHRGGYFHCNNIDPLVRNEIYKLASTTLCSNTTGEMLVGLMSNPPRPGDPSYELYHLEVRGIYESLRRRAKMLAEALGKMQGVTCNAVEGALYAFPRIRLPHRAVVAAKAAGVPADTYYCLRLLDETGICTVPGSGFGQQEGTFHFRTTILAQEEDFDYLTQSFQEFHARFISEYS